MNLVPDSILLVYVDCRQMARFIYDTFLEKTKLKDDGSNYADWVRNLRIILIAAQKS